MSEYFRVSIDFILGVDENLCRLTDGESDEFLVLKIRSLNTSRKCKLVEITAGERKMTGSQ